MRRRTLPAWMILCCAALLAAAPAPASDLWLHVRVDEGEGGAKVSVNLPVSMLEAALPMLAEHGGPRIHGSSIHLDDHHVSVEEMRTLWKEVKSSPDMTFVTFEEKDESVRVWKEGGHLFVRVREDGDETSVDVRVPVAVVDALLAGEGDELDLKAAIEVLVAQGEGDLVTVRDRDDHVRVWVDRVAEAGLEGR